ncbi:MAG: LysR family transcriptional regulator [Rhodocyclaceae bacterium]|nr:LysR family transcriptional regulator [Rhodocyclaceae bacterium]
MFEISQIRCFVAVAEELHFSRAAERLNMTQPPLSRQIRLLEHHVGTQLLDRTSRSVRLTAAGRAFLPEAARILRMAEEAAATARRVAKGERGSLSIGFTAASGYGLLPRVVRLIREQAPGISLTLKELVSGSQLEALDAGKLDLGLLRPHAEHGELESLSVLNESLVLAIPGREADKWPARPRPADLNGKPFLMYSPYEAHYFYQLLQVIFERDGVNPDIVEYLSQIHTMLALVHSGIGVAVIPEAAMRLHFEGILMRRLETDPPQPVQTVCSFRRDNDNPILRAFREQVLPQLSEP